MAERTKKVDRDEFTRLNADGWTIPQLAEHFKIHQISVTRLRRQLGISPDKRRMLTPERRARIEAMLDDGWSFSEIHRTEGADRDMLHREFPGRAWTMQQQNEYRAALRAAEPALAKSWPTSHRRTA